MNRNAQQTAVLTTGRQDFGVLRGILMLMDASPDFDLHLLVGGMHLSRQFGSTVNQIKDDGLVPAAELRWLNDQGDTSINDQSAFALQTVGEALREIKPDYLVVVGDRYETMAAALAATLERVPIVHLHGGEETEGAIDNVFRHAITKLSHLHFVSHPMYAERVVQMGEHPDLVHTVGAPGLDNLFRPDLPTRRDLDKRLEIELKITCCNRYSPPNYSQPVGDVYSARKFTCGYEKYSSNLRDNPTQFGSPKPAYPK